MVTRSLKGFTVVELLLVVAIIGILSAMLFPVFAGARESARQAVCLSNVENIARAIQMYLADNDSVFMTGNADQEVMDYFATAPGPEHRWAGGETCGFEMGWRANPYLRPPVMLDEYVRNRKVWSCPHAKMESGALVIIPGADWLATIQANEGQLGLGGNLVCIGEGVYPPGWGGDITDSFLQGLVRASDKTGVTVTGRGGKAFRQSVSMNYMPWLYYGNEVDWTSDLANTIVCGDGGVVDSTSPGGLAYPDICAAECGNYWCGGAWDPESMAYNPALPTECGAVHASPSMIRNQALLMPYTRHQGGTNIGYADGHAAWMSSQEFLDTWAEEAQQTAEIWHNSAFGLHSWALWSFAPSCYDCGDPYLR